MKRAAIPRFEAFAVATRWPGTIRSSPCGQELFDEDPAEPLAVLARIPPMPGPEARGLPAATTNVA